MTRRTVTLMQELPHFLRTCSVEELYQVARALRHDLVRRGMSAALVADELAEQLLLDARVEHRQIFSADCSDSERVYLDHGEPLLAPGRPASRPAEQSSRPSNPSPLSGVFEVWGPTADPAR